MEEKNLKNQNSNIKSLKLKKVALDIRKKYAYLDIDDETFNNIVEEQLELVFTLSNNNLDEQDLLYKLLIKYFDEYIKEELKGKNYIEIINNFINLNIKSVDNFELSMSELDKIKNFLEKYEFKLDIDKCMCIINSNSTLKILLKNITDLKLNISYQDIETDESFFSVFVQAYCLISDTIICKEDELLYGEDYKEEINKLDASDSVKLYLKDIGRFKLLGADEERELAVRMASGDQEARKKLIESNLRLVVSLAKRFSDRGITFLDLIQEGNLGLMRAVEKFDLSKECKFSTYATWWIKQYLSRATFDKSRVIRIPIHVLEQVLKCRGVIENFQKQYNRRPTIDEISKELDCAPEKVKEYLSLMEDAVSLNSKVGTEDGEEDTELLDMIDSGCETPEDKMLFEEKKSRVDNLLKSGILKPREVEIMILRYGFNNGEIKTLDQIAEIYNITRERVRQIESAALRKLRRYKKITDFAQYMDNPEKAINLIESCKKEKKI